MPRPWNRRQSCSKRGTLCEKRKIIVMKRRIQVLYFLRLYLRIRIRFTFFRFNLFIFRNLWWTNGCSFDKNNNRILAIALQLVIDMISSTHICALTVCLLHSCFAWSNLWWCWCWWNTVCCCYSLQCASSERTKMEFRIFICSECCPLPELQTVRLWQGGAPNTYAPLAASLASSSSSRLPSTISRNGYVCPIWFIYCL